MFLKFVLSTYVAIWVNVSVSFYMAFQKKSLLIKVYVLFLPACPYKLCELTKMAKAKDSGTMRASNHLSAF